MKDNLIIYVGIGITVIISFIVGKDFGEEKIQAQFNEYKLEMSKKILEEKVRYDSLLSQHQAREAIYVSNLKLAKEEYEETINSLNDDLSNRLQQSEERASIYKRQAESDTNGLRDLADHAAKLDKSLEQGRSLVKELRETVKLREEQLRILNEVMSNDRKLINE